MSTLPTGSPRPCIVDVINLSSSADTLLRERVLALREQGLDNHIVCMDGPYVAPLRARGIPVHTVPNLRGMNPLHLAQAVLATATVLRRLRPQLVHTHCSVPGLVGRLAARLAGVPVVIHTVHGFHFHDGGRGLSESLAVLAERVAGALTDRLLSQNRSDMELAVKRHIVDEDRLQYVGNGIDLRRFPETAAREPNAVPVLVCVARMEPVKNHDLLLDAVCALRARGEALELWLIGGGEGRAALEARCERDGLTDVVRFLGYRDDVPALLARADIGVLTSHKEGIPRAALECMAAGLPMVATRVTGTREVVRHEDSGLLVADDDAAALTEALARLLHDAPLRARMGERGRAVVAAEFDEAEIVRRLGRIYHSELTRHGIAAPAALAPAAAEAPAVAAAPAPAAARMGRNAAFRLAAQVASALINVAGMVLLGNHLSAAGYGAYVFWYALLPLFASVADLGAGTILTREIARTPEHAARLIGDGLLLKAVLGTVLLALCAAVALPVLGTASTLLLLLVTAGALADFSQDPGIWAARAFERLDLEAALLLVSQTAWLAGIAVALAFDAPLAALLAVAAGAFALRMVAGVLLLRRLCGMPRLHWDAARLGALARESAPFGVAMLLVVLYGRTGVLLLKALAADADVACFNVAYMLSQPLGFIASALSVAAFPALARYARENHTALRGLLQRASRYQLLATLPLGVGLWLLAEPVIALLFHKGDFARAAASLRIVALSLPFVFLNLQSRYVLAAMDRQRAYLVAVTLGLAANLGVGALAIPHFGAVGAAWAFVAAEAVIFAACHAALAMHVSLADLMRSAARPGVAAACMGLLVFAVRGFDPWLAVLAGLVSYAAGLLLMRAITRDELDLLRDIARSLRVPGLRSLQRGAERS